MTTDTQVLNHNKAIDIASCFSAPTAQNFIKTGCITPGLRAMLNLYQLSGDNFSVDIDFLSDYVNERVASNQLDTPADWPN